MKRTLNPPFILTFLLIIILSSCDKCQNDSFKDVKFKGVVTLRAEADHNIGLIKLIPIGEEKELETPSRGIIYKYKDNPVFDLGDTVYFSVSNNGNFQHAIDSDTILRGELVDQAYFYNSLDKFQLNFHNADLHREGPQHKIWHIRAESRVTADVGPGLIALTIESPPSNPKNIYFDEDQMPEDQSSDLFINEISPREILPLNSVPYTKFNIFTSHEHAH